MSTGAAGDGLLRGVFDSCISGKDLGIKRRPYHKNCKCALHKARGHCSHSRSNSISFPIRRSWSDGCLALMNNSSHSATTSGVTSPVQLSPRIAAEAEEEEMIIRAHTHLVLCNEEGGDPYSVLYKV